MKIVFCFLLYAAFVVADPIIHSSSLESKIGEGEILEDVKEFLCVASLQINRTHYCSAGMFKPGFLITTGACVRGIELERSNADVVLDNKDLNKGERYEIVKLTKHRNYDSSRKYINPRDYDVGVIMIRVDDIKKNLSTLPLGRRPINLIYDGRFAKLCGWRVATESELNPNILKCMKVWIHSREKCRIYSPEIDFKLKHYCGDGGPMLKLDPKDYGSPLIMTYEGHDGYQPYIIGVATGTFEFEGCSYTRFVRSTFIFADVQIMVEQFERGKISAQSVPDVSSMKRRKLEEHNKERKKENNDKEKRRKVLHVPE